MSGASPLIREGPLPSGKVRLYPTRLGGTGSNGSKFHAYLRGESAPAKLGATVRQVAVSHRSEEGRPAISELFWVNDQKLVEKARNGDQAAFRTLYDRNVDRIYRLVYRMAGEPELAMDFTQDAFVRAYERLDQYRGDAAFSTWLHSIAVSVALNGLRRVDRHRKRESSLEDVAAPPARRNGTDPGVRERIESAVDGLPEIYRTVFLMHDLEGLSHAEIAKSLGVAEGTSKARLSRARARLREELGDAMQEYV